jgi:hypothetical protein
MKKFLIFSLMIIYIFSTKIIYKGNGKVITENDLEIYKNFSQILENMYLYNISNEAKVLYQSFFYN